MTSLYGLLLIYNIINDMLRHLVWSVDIMKVQRHKNGPSSLQVHMPVHTLKRGARSYRPCACVIVYLTTTLSVTHAQSTGRTVCLKLDRFISPVARRYPACEILASLNPMFDGMTERIVFWPNPVNFSRYDTRNCQIRDFLKPPCFVILQVWLFPVVLLVNL